MDYFNLNADLYYATVGSNPHLQTLPPVDVGFTTNQTDSGEHCGHRLVDFGLTHDIQTRGGSRPQT